MIAPLFCPQSLDNLRTNWNISGLPNGKDFIVQVFQTGGKNDEKCYFPFPFPNKCLAILFGDTTTGTLYSHGYDPSKTTNEYFIYKTTGGTTSDGTMAMAIGY